MQGGDMSFKRLIEMGDERIREEIGDYYYISKDRMDELIRNFDLQCTRIAEMSRIIEIQQFQIKDLQGRLITESDID